MSKKTVILHSKGVRMVERDMCHGRIVAYRPDPEFEIRDLGDKPQATFIGSPMPYKLWRSIHDFMVWSYRKHAAESLVLLLYNPLEDSWDAWAPPQVASCAMAVRTLEQDPDFTAQRATWGKDWIVFGSVHHHCSSAPFASSTDADDEKNKDGLHITVGYCDRLHTELHVRTSIMTEVRTLKQTYNDLTEWIESESAIPDYVPSGDLTDKLYLASLCYRQETAKGWLEYDTDTGLYFPGQWAKNIRKFTVVNGPDPRGYTYHHQQFQQHHGPYNTMLTAHGKNETAASANVGSGNGTSPGSPTPVNPDPQTPHHTQTSAPMQTGGGANGHKVKVLFDQGADYHLYAGMAKFLFRRGHDLDRLIQSFSFHISLDMLQEQFITLEQIKQQSEVMAITVQPSEVHAFSLVEAELGVGKLWTFGKFLTQETGYLRNIQRMMLASGAVPAPGVTRPITTSPSAPGVPA